MNFVESRDGIKCEPLKVDRLWGHHKKVAIIGLTNNQYPFSSDLDSERFVTGKFFVSPD